MRLAPLFPRGDVIAYVFIQYFIGDSLLEKTLNTLLYSRLCLQKASQKPHLSFSACTNVTFAEWHRAHWPFPQRCILPLLELTCNWSLANANVTSWQWRHATFQLGQVHFKVKFLVVWDRIIWHANIFQWQVQHFRCHYQAWSFLPLDELQPYSAIKACSDRNPTWPALTLRAPQWSSPLCFSSVHKAGKFDVSKNSQTCYSIVWPKQGKKIKTGTTISTGRPHSRLETDWFPQRQGQLARVAMRDLQRVTEKCLSQFCKALAVERNSWIWSRLEKVRTVSKKSLSGKKFSQPFPEPAALIHPHEPIVSGASPALQNYIIIKNYVPTVHHRAEKQKLAKEPLAAALCTTVEKLLSTRG